MRSTQVDFSDVQGLVRFGFGPLKGAVYLLLRVKNAEAARSWLRSAAITNAVKVSPAPSTAMQVAFTAPGLRALGVSDSVVESFSHEFVTGMTEPSRSRRLGDVGNNAPHKWRWGAGSSEAEEKETMPHVLVMFFAQPESLESFVQSSTGSGWNEAFVEVQRLETSNLDGIEPFGFADGISQPEIDWSQERDVRAAQIDYSNRVTLGEFLLGYRNEYGKYTDRPLVDSDASSAGLLAAEDSPDKKDAGRNGTYLVLRDLRQDVGGFWQFVNEQAGGDAAKAEKLAEAMVGRRKDGYPLVPIQQKAIPGVGTERSESRRKEDIAKNQFTFDGDPAGTRCPFGAHVRRANPRNTDFPGRPVGLLAKLITMLGFGPKGFRDDLMSSVRFHRILRRGREYGPGLSAEKGSRRRAGGRSGAWTTLRLSQRQHFAPVRVLAECVDREHQVLGFDRGERSVARRSRADTRLSGYQRFQYAPRRRPASPRFRTASICDRTGRRLLLSSQSSRVTLLRQRKDDG